MANFFQFQANYGRPADSPYIPQPVEKMGEAILESSRTNALGNQALNDVLNLKVDSLNVHKDELQNIKNQYDSEVNSLADELSKNPNKTTFQKIAELRKRVKSDLDATGRLGKIQNAYDQYAGWQKDLDEETKKYNESGGTKGIDADTRNKKIQMLQYNLGNWYKEKGLTDKEIPLPKIVGHVDVENLAYDLAQKLPTMSYDSYTKWAKQNDLNTVNSEVFQQIKTENQGNIYSVDSKGRQYFDPNKLNRVVGSFLSNDPKVVTYLSDRADIDIFDNLSNDLLLNPDASEEIRNQYKRLYPQLREKIVNSKINDIAQRTRDAFSSISTGYSDKTHTSTIPKWALDIDNDSSGQQFTITVTNTLGQTSEEEKKALSELSSDFIGNLELNGRFAGEVVKTKVHPKTKETIYITRDGNEYFSSREPNLRVTKPTEEQKRSKITELQRKYADIVDVTKPKNEEELVKNINTALNKEGNYNYNINIPEIVIYSKYLQGIIAGNPTVFNAKKTDKEGKPTDDEFTENDYRNLKNSSYTLNPITGKLKTTSEGTSIIMDIPNEFKNILQPTKDLYSVSQKVWMSGETQSFTDNTGKTVTIKRELNPKTKKYEVLYYHPDLIDQRVKIEDMINAQAEIDLKRIQEYIKKRDLFYNTSEENE